MAVALDVSPSESHSQQPLVQKPKRMASNKSPRSQCLTLESRIADGMKPNDIRIVKVQDAVFKLPYSFFERMPTEIRAAIFQQHSGTSLDDAPVLRGHTIEQFKTLLWSHFSYPSLSLKSLTLDRLLTIAELAYQYRLRHLMAWGMHAVTVITNHPDSPLRTAPSEAFVRILEVAIRYRQAEAVAAIKTKWMTRIHWHELSPIPALIVADRYNIRDMLSHAYYVYLALMEARIAKSLPIDNDGLLSPKQKMHIYCGYYSLRTYWGNLRRTAPKFTQQEGCSGHSQCVEVWEKRWSVAAARSSVTTPEVDVLTRLRFMQQSLEGDMLLSVCMTVQCRERAIASISKKRQHISDNLHHHFDLDL